MQGTTKMLATTLAVSLIFIALFKSVSFAVDPKKDIVGIWLLDEGKGDVVADSSGHERHGTRMDAAKWVKGKFGNALDFSASQASRVDIPDEDALDLVTFSVTAWAKVEEGGDNLIVGKIDQADRSLRNYYICLDDHGFNAGCSGQGGWASGITGDVGSVQDGEWHHLAITYDKKFFRAYQDGEQVIEKASSITPDTHDYPLVIGGIPQWTPVRGVVDEVGVFNRALTPVEIKSIMEKGLIEGFPSAVHPKGKLATFWGKLKVE